MKNSMIIQMVGEVVSHTKKPISDEAGYAEVVIKYYENNIENHLVLIGRNKAAEKIFNELRKGKIIMVVGKRWDGEAVYFGNIKGRKACLEVIDFNVVFDTCH